MERVTIPYSGGLLVSHLAAYGLAWALDAAGVVAFVGHDPESQSFEPVVAFDATLERAREAIRASAVAAQEFVEHDIEPGKTGNDRRATIWSRATIAADSERLEQILALRARLVDAAERAPGPIALGLLGGLGAPAAWGPGTLRTSEGATALDGVLGNHTSDFVRGVLRPTRRAAEALDPDPFTPDGTTGLPLDRTGWAPPGTRVDYVHQWLAALGLALLPVAHRPLSSSATPACWRANGGRRGVTLPLLARPVSIPRLRALLGLAALASLTSEEHGGDDAARVAYELRSLGIEEVVLFERRDRAGAGSSVAFDFRRGRRIALR